MKQKSFFLMICLTLWLTLAIPEPSPTAGLTPAEWTDIQTTLASDYLKASNPGTGDQFGYNVVAIDGNTLVIGAHEEDSNATGVNGNQMDDSATDAGAVYVFVREANGTWSQQAYLKASNTGAGDFFGYSVDIAGDTIIIGTPREDSQATGINGNQADNTASNSGAAYIFTRTAGVWSQQAYLKASNTEANDLFGYSVAIDGDTIVVGAYQEDSNATGVNGNQTDNSAIWAGAVYVFTRTAGEWSQQAYLKASNTDAIDLFGYTVALDGNTIVVGAHEEDGGSTGVNGNEASNTANESGAAYVFTRTAGVWSQQAYLKASNTEALDFFGHAVAVEGDTIVVGAIWEDSQATGINGNQADNSASDAGAAYIFTRTAGQWSQQAYLKASNTGAVDFFSQAVAIEGDTVVMGAYVEDSNATGVNGDQANNLATNSGAAYIFVRTAGQWSQQTYLKASNTEAYDFFGAAVAIAEDTIVVGANGEDSSATGVNGDQADNSASDAGAVYVFAAESELVVQRAGEGQVSSTPAGISCGAICTAVFSHNTVVTLTATPDSGFIFAGWSGDLSGTTNPITITIEGDTTITATFTAEANEEYLVYLPLLDTPQPPSFWGQWRLVGRRP